MPVRPDVQRDWGRADRFGDQIEDIIRANAGAIISVGTATAEQDQRQATDLVVRTDAGALAARVRFDIKWRDLTLRCARLRGGEWVYGFEAQKIAEGWGDWYCYIWVSEMERELDDWVFVDLDAIRAAGLIEAPQWLVRDRDKENTDGRTRFTWITLDEIIAADALVASSDDMELAEAEVEEVTVPRGPYRFRCKCPVPEIGRDGRCVRCRGNPQQPEPMVWVGWNNPDPLARGPS